MHVLDSHDSSSPVLSDLGVVVVLTSEVLLESLKVLVVFLSHVSQSDSGGSLLVDELSESSFSLNNAEGDTLLSAESWEIQDEFNWINIMGNSNELGISAFDELSDVVESVFKSNWLLVVLSVLSSSLLGSLGFKSVSLLFLVLGRVLSKKFEKLMSYC